MKSDITIAVKAGKSAIRPWQSCKYTENMLMDKLWFGSISWVS